MPPPMDWNGLRVFLAVARAGSMRGASEVLGVSHTTISRRLSALESQLGVRLFDALPAGYRPTEAGTRILDLAQQVEAGMFGIERLVGGSDGHLSGRVRLTLPLPMFVHMFADALVRFSQRWPEIELDIDTTMDLLDLSRFEADVAVRILRDGTTPPEDLVGRPVATFDRAIYASPAYLARHDPHDPGSGACWIGWDEGVTRPDWVLDSPFPDLPARHGLSDVLAQVAAARAGLGLAMLPTTCADADSGLVRVPGTQAEPAYEVWLLSHPDLRDNARIRAVKSFLLELFEEDSGRGAVARTLRAV